MSRRNRGYGWWTFGWLEAERKRQPKDERKTNTRIQLWTWIILSFFGILILLETMIGIFE